VAAIWGIAFVATRVGLDSFSPPALAALRFVIASAAAVFVARPRVPWPALCAIGGTLFAGQFLFQFFGIALGMPPGLAAVVVQTQALFTILLAAVALAERPTVRQLTGTAVAFAGLGAIAATVGGDLTPVGLGLTTLSAVSWAIGNTLLKRLPRVELLSLIAWLSLVPPLPCLALAVVLDGPGDLVTALGRASWAGVAAAVYLGLVATVLAYAIWAHLLRRYPAAMVAPFALLAPFVAAAGSSIVFGERFTPLRLAGMALVLAGLAIILASRNASANG
jgi:O-acetylserine/cysteine efflux transporter